MLSDHVKGIEGKQPTCLLCHQDGCQVLGKRQGRNAILFMKMGDKQVNGGWMGWEGIEVSNNAEFNKQLELDFHVFLITIFRVCQEPILEPINIEGGKALPICHYEPIIIGVRGGSWGMMWTIRTPHGPHPIDGISTLWRPH